MENIPLEFKIKAHEVCRDYLGGVWRTIDQNEIIIEKFSGGYINLTLKISLPPNSKPVKGEPLQVVMKNHLGLLGEGYFRQMTENVIAVILANKKLHPKVYGCFDGGRLDEYVIARPLGNKDLRNPTIISAIARKLAHLHSLKLPINKDPNKMYNQTKGFLDIACNDPRNKLDNPKLKAVINHLRSENPYKELKWIKELIDSINPTVVYCHGDLQPNNILLCKNAPNNPVHIIDLDLCGYNYRGFDFSSLYNGFCFVVPYPDPPYYKTDWDLYPTEKDQRFIFSVYLEEIQKINKVKLDIENEMKKLLKETEVLLLFYQYFVFAFLAGRKDDSLTNKLDWEEGAELLLNRYKELKETFTLKI